MHHKLPHDALQEEEARAVVIEVDPELSEEEEEYYVADFEDDYGHGYYDQEEEPGGESQSPTSLEDERPRLCHQRVTLEVDGDLVTMHTLYDWGSTVTLVRRDAA
jgi:hypothetical protein